MEILSNQELHDLTGYCKASKIVEWLQKNSVPFLIARTGQPKVHKDALAHRMGVPNVNSNDTDVTTKVLPNFQNLEK